MSTFQLHSEPIILRVARALASYIGFGSDDAKETASARKSPFECSATSRPRSTPVRSAATTLRLMPSVDAPETATDHKWRRHAQLRAYSAPIPADVRQGRHEAVRGLFAAREGALDVASQHFMIAASCEDVDITAVPGFWNLTRGQMLTAVSAYESVERYRDAAALDAHIATIFRPSLVGSSIAPIVPARAERKAAIT